MAYEWLTTAGMFWLGGWWYALVWYEGDYGKALGWPIHLLNHLTSRYMPPRVWHAVTWPLVAVAVARTFNII